MNIQINIDCETIGELYSHLTMLRSQIKKEATRLKLNPNDDEFTPEMKLDLDDANCYGEHEVLILEPKENHQV